MGTSQRSVLQLIGAACLLVMGGACSLTSNAEPLDVRRCEGAACADPDDTGSAGDTGADVVDTGMDAEDEGEGEDAEDASTADGSGEEEPAVEVRCELSSDCAQRTCFEARCAAGECSYAPSAAARCDDGDACTTEDTCQPDGACAGRLMPCVTPEPSSCADDSTFVTWDPVGWCEAGQCMYRQIVRECPQCADTCLQVCANVICPQDDDSCTTSSCDPSTRSCADSLAADGVRCQGPNLNSGYCAQGRCVECAEDMHCSDGDECTTDLCLGNRCEFRADVLRDGIPCERGVCLQGRCVECIQDANCGSRLCQIGRCDVDTNTCYDIPAEDGTSCHSGGFCWSGRCEQCGTDAQCGGDLPWCVGGRCRPCDHLRGGGQGRCADDGNACTDEVCTMVDTCFYSPANDGGPCVRQNGDQGGQCSAGVCQ